MAETRWDELDQLGQQMAVLKRLLDRAAEYGDQPETKRLNAEISRVKDRRHDLLMSIAELSIAA